MQKAYSAQRRNKKFLSAGDKVIVSQRELFNPIPADFNVYEFVEYLGDKCRLKSGDTFIVKLTSDIERYHPQDAHNNKQ